MPRYKSIRGLQAAQAGVLKAIAAVKPDGSLDEATRQVGTQAHRLAVTYSHVQTGAMRASQLITRDRASRYIVHLNQSAVNPRSGARVAVYGVAEHERGGDHAFYERTYRRGNEILDRAASYLMRSLP